MRSAQRLVRRIALFLVVVASLAAPAGPAQATAAGRPDASRGDRQVSAIELVRQTATVPRGGTFEMVVRTDTLPADGSLDVVVHGRVRSRSELSASVEGTSLRSQVYRVSTPLAALADGGDGTRRVAISLDPAVSGGVAISAAGAYPVELVARDGSGAELTTLVTHLIVEPRAQDAAPPLSVAVVAELDAAPTEPAGGVRPAVDVNLDRAAEVVAALVDHPDVAATLALRPEVLDALAQTADPAQAALLDALPAAATGRSVLALPYVDVSPDALVGADLASELTAQLERGRQVLEDVLRIAPTGTTWLAAEDLGPEGLALLADAGVRHVVVDADQVEPLRSGVLALSLAQPFLLDPDLDPTVDALALDPEVTGRLGTRVTPGLEVSRVLAELAVLWFEQPGIDRGVVLPIGPAVRGEVLDGLLDGLAGDAIFTAVTVDDLFAAADPLRQPGGGLVDRTLEPQGATSIDRTVGRELDSVRELLSSFETMLGPDSPRAEPIAAQLLLATARTLDHAEQRAHLVAARSAVGEVVDAISATNQETITLTARDGTIPLTLRNDAGVPVKVVVRLRSPKLEFPSGERRSLTLTEATTRIDVDVRARASGSFPLQVEVSSPDGRISLATIDVRVQSTAVSGVGVVLSAGAALFLLVWWARHWRRTRRSEKLVASSHPATRDAQ